MKEEEAPYGQFVLDCRALYGDDLESVCVYGSAVTEDYLPGVSDYNLCVVLRELTADHLRRAAPYIRKWAKLRISPPLFLDTAFIQSGPATFPIEFSEIKRAHKMLYGQDRFLDLPVSQGNLRGQGEYEIRSILMAVRQAYLQVAGSPTEVIGLARESLKSVLLILRNLLSLLGETVPGNLSGVIDRVEARWGVALPTLRRVLAIRTGAERVRRREAGPLFAAYLAEIAAIADGLEKTLGPKGEPGGDQ